MKIIIKKIHGNRDYEIDFDKKCTIFVGPNGTGKSTALNICSNILSGNIIQTLKYKYEEIIIYFKSDNQKQKLVVKRKDLIPDIEIFKEYYNNLMFIGYLDESGEFQISEDYPEEGLFGHGRRVHLFETKEKFDEFYDILKEIFETEELYYKMFMNSCTFIKKDSQQKINRKTKYIFGSELYQYQPYIYYNLQNIISKNKRTYYRKSVDFYKDFDLCVGQVDSWDHDIGFFNGVSYFKHSKFYKESSNTHLFQKYLEIVNNTNKFANILLNQMNDLKITNTPSYYKENDRDQNMRFCKRLSISDMLYILYDENYFNKFKNKYQEFLFKNHSKFMVPYRLKQSELDIYMNYFYPYIYENTPADINLREKFEEDLKNHGLLIHTMVQEFKDEFINYTNPKINKINSLFKKYFKDKTIFLSPSKVIISKTNKLSDDIPFEYLSIGEQRLIAMILTSIVYDNCIILVDEPETSLSIVWQKTLLPDLIANDIKNVTVATQSPYIVNDESLLDYVEWINDNYE